jgi:hypothetical protein
MSHTTVRLYTAMPTPRLLHVFAGALVAEVATLSALRATGRGGESVREWYLSYGASAVAMDVCSAAFAAQVGLSVAETPLGALAAALLVQQAHDVAFGAWLARSVSSERGDVLGLFRRYAGEVGHTILAVDALIVALAVGGAFAMATRDDGHVASVAFLSGYATLLLAHTDG